MQTAGQEPLDGATGGSAPASGGAAPASGGGSANGSCPTDDGGIGAATSTASQPSEEDDGECENWLVALAKAMAEIQNKFLDKAMKAKSTMEENMQAMDEAADAKSEGRGNFLKAQGEFQADMQMFNTFMSMSNNMLKTLGQALNTMSSKQ
jgi:hypothetical protein